MLGFLTITCCSALLVVVLARSGGRPVPAAAGTARHPENCLLWVDGPTKLYACADGHSWAVTDGAWADAGPLTPVGPVPRS